MITKRWFQSDKILIKFYKSIRHLQFLHIMRIPITHLVVNIRQLWRGLHICLAFSRELLISVNDTYGYAGYV